MRPPRIVVLKGVRRKLSSTPELQEVTFDELKSWVLRGQLHRHLFRYRDARVLVHRWDVTSKRFATAVLLRLLSRGRCYWEDAEGHTARIGVRTLMGLLWRWLVDAHVRLGVSRSARVAAARLASFRTTDVALDLAASPVYLRTDLWFGVPSGGSVGHIAGVLNHLGEFTGEPVFLSTDEIPTVRTDIERHILPSSDLPWEFAEAPSLAFNEVCQRRTQAILAGRRIGFVYQRYSLNNYTGLALARRAGVPFVLEYNGSEVWIARNWGRPLKYEALSLRIERLNLEGADLVVVVSEAIADTLRRSGISARRILVNPNGVDPERYSPAKDGGPVRRELGLEHNLVVGFIGTFGPWHGAEVLAEAFVALMHRAPALRPRARLLLIGDGDRLPQTREILERGGVLDLCRFTGLVPQSEGPAHLAACDVLVSPHVPNPDGTPFFGSPTKLFEYMAMGKAIVASDLDQIGEVLAHDRTALLVTPGSITELASGLEVLLADPARRDSLGRAAREEVVAQYTWRAHTGRIVDRLRELCPKEAVPGRPNLTMLNR